MLGIGLAFRVVPEARRGVREELALVGAKDGTASDGCEVVCRAELGEKLGGTLVGC